MSIKPQYSTIDKNELSYFEEQNTVECSLNLSDEHFDNILSLTAEIVPKDTEIADGKIRYGGKVIFNAVYLSDETERVEAGVEFNFAANTKAEAVLSAVNVELKKSQGILYASAIINAAFSAERKEEISYLSDVNRLKNETALNAYRQLSSSGVFDLEDEFETVKIKRVLHSAAKAVITSVEPGVNSVIICGDIYLSVTVLPFFENSDILKEVRCIPFRLELETDGLSPTDYCSARAEYCSVALKAYVEEGSDKTTISAICSLKLKVSASACTVFSAVTDVAAPECALILSETPYTAKRIVGQFAASSKLSGKFDCAVPESSRFVTLIGEKATVGDIKIIEDTAELDALVSARALFVDGDGKLVSAPCELATSLKLPVSGEKVVDCELNAVDCFARLRSGKLEADGYLKASLTTESTENATLVSEIAEGDKKEVSDASVSVYLPSEGDTEWNVVKELGLPIETVYEFNPELSFPLKGNERIICFREK